MGYPQTKKENTYRTTGISGSLEANTGKPGRLLSYFIR
jgi:hypothetical protein